MTNTDLLNDKIKLSGKKKGYLAKKCNLSTAGFYNCCNNKAEWKANQIDVLCSEINIRTLSERQAIFFAKSDALKASKETTNESI